MITKNIASVGVELEGGITQNHANAVQRKYNKTELENDGSVDVRLKTRARTISDAELKYWSTSTKRMEKFITYVFHDGKMFGQNETCGNHVHVKFNDMDKAVAIFSYKPAREKFLQEYREFAQRQNIKFATRKYTKRLDNDYCSARINDTDAILQIQDRGFKSRSRYRAINLNSFSIHGTIEFRILPHMSSHKEFMEALNWLIKTVDSIMNEDFGNYEQDGYSTIHIENFKKVLKNPRLKILIKREV